MPTTLKTLAPTKKGVWEDGSKKKVSRDVVDPFGGAGASSQGSREDLLAAVNRRREQESREMRPGMGPRKKLVEDDMKLPARAPATKLPNAKPVQQTGGQLYKTIGTKSKVRESKKARPNARGPRDKVSFSPQTIERRLGLRRGK